MIVKPILSSYCDGNFWANLVFTLIVKPCLLMKLETHLKVQVKSVILFFFQSSWPYEESLKWWQKLNGFSDQQPRFADQLVVHVILHSCIDKLSWSWASFSVCFPVASNPESVFQFDQTFSGQPYCHLHWQTWQLPS